MTKQKKTRARTVRLSREDALQQASDRPTRATIQVIGGAAGDLGMHEPLDTPLVVGRGEEASFQLSDDSASRTNCWIGWDDTMGAYVVRDTGSTNGTYVNGVRVQEAVLRHGDRMDVGETLLEFRMADDREIQTREQIEAWLSTDDLTGLPNKRRFDAELKRREGILASQSTWLAILMLDVDNLKAINDHHGHHLGSRTIREVGQIIGSLTAGKGQGTRYGGDEYTVFLVAHDLTAALALGEQIRTAVENLTLDADDGTLVHTTISIGVAAARGTDLDVDRLTREADKALYRAKEKGRNTVSD